MKIEASDLSVSEKMILHEWRRCGTVHLRLRSDLSVDQAASCLRKSRLELALPGLGEMGLGGVAATSQGPVLILHEVPDRKEALELVRRIADNLREQGVVGRLMSCGFQKSPLENSDRFFPAIAAGISLRGNPSFVPPVPNAGRARAEYHWDIDPMVLGTVFDYALQWCNVPSGKYFVNSGLTQFKCEQEECGDLLSAAYGAIPTAALTCAAGPNEARRVAITHDGFLTFEWYLPTGAWKDGVAELTGVLEAMADYAQYGLVKRIDMPGFAWQTLIDLDWPVRPHLRTSSMWGQELMTELIPDAFAVQLLSSTHVLPDLNGQWDSRPVGRSSALLTHTDLSTWFDGRHPRQETLETARDSLSALFMNDAMLRDKKADFFGEHLRTPAHTLFGH
ncbi:hypothetical protein ACRB8A_09760 [Arthrobacter sp. G.S.26]|uniref:hypothetical protein n=1 Tax=Arthrobacter sp. G.S.26 TaxID=3433706 RepID=UPI003D78298A